MKKLLLAVCILLAGCDREPAPQNIQSDISADFGRFTVTQVATFSDSDAYNGSRKIFLLRDNSTDKEFVGISGVGISEVGSHRSGKITKQDER